MFRYKYDNCPARYAKNVSHFFKKSALTFHKDCIFADVRPH